jgi:hypothetical protein
VASELQALIDAQISEGGTGGGVLLSKGVLEVRETLRIASVRGFRFGGQAPWATELRWLGPDDTPLFDIDRCEDFLLEDFSISIASESKLVAAAWIQHGRGGTGRKAAPGAFSSHVLWKNVHVRGEGNLGYGFQVKLADPGNDVKNDHHSFEQVTVTGYRQSAFSLEGRNAKNIGFHRCHCLGLLDRRRIGKVAVETWLQPNHVAAFFWSDGVAIGNDETDFKLGAPNDTIKIDGVSSEKSARVLQMPESEPGAEVASPVVLKNYRFGTGNPQNPPAADGEVIQCEATGPLSIIACKIGTGIPHQQLRIRYDPKPPPGAFNFIGNAIGNDGDGQIFTASPPTMPYQNRNLGYRDGKWQPLP